MHKRCSKVRQMIQRTATHPLFERLARFGYVSKAVVYFIVGVLAVQAALTAKDRPTDTSGALRTIVVQPLGKLLLALVALGIVGYVLWRMVQALLDPEHAQQTLSAKRIVQRISYAASAIAYSGLAFTAIKLITESAGENNETIENWTARFLQQPFGRWVVGFAGFVVIAVGCSYFYRAYKAKFQRHFKQNQMSQVEKVLASWLGRFGIAARGVVFVLIGLFLIVAAVQSDADKARGLGGVLAALAARPFGFWLLGMVALGLIAYSVYLMIEARYRQISANP